MIDQIMGKPVEPIRTGNNSGSPSLPANQEPISAPTKPSAIETRQPPRENPLIACPSDPQIPAINSRSNKSMSVISFSLAIEFPIRQDQDSKPFLSCESCQQFLTPQIIAEDSPALHHKSHSLEFGNIAQRIAGNRNDVGVLPRFNCAHVVRSFQQISGDRSG